MSTGDYQTCKSCGQTMTLGSVHRCPSLNTYPLPPFTPPFDTGGYSECPQCHKSVDMGAEHICGPQPRPPFQSYQPGQVWQFPVDKRVEVALLDRIAYDLEQIHDLLMKLVSDVGKCH